MIFNIAKFAGKGLYKLARKTPKKVYKYGAVTGGGAYIGDKIGKKRERKKILGNVEKFLQQSNSKYFK